MDRPSATAATARRRPRRWSRSAREKMRHRQSRDSTCGTHARERIRLFRHPHWCRRDLTIEACFPKVCQYHIAIVATPRRGADNGDRARPDQRIHDIWHCLLQQGINRARPTRCTSISPAGKSAARCGRAICRSPHPSAAGQRTPRPAPPWTGRTPPTKVRP